MQPPRAAWGKLEQSPEIPARRLPRVEGAEVPRLEYEPAGRAHAQSIALEPDGFSSNRHPALSFCLSMSFFAKPVPLLRDMLWASLQNRNRRHCVPPVIV